MFPSLRIVVGNDGDSSDEKTQDTSDVSERRHSSSDPVNLSLGCRDREDDSNDGHIDVETIGNAPSKVSYFTLLLKIEKNLYLSTNNNLINIFHLIITELDTSTLT